jgi:hypothetical protein
MAIPFSSVPIAQSIPDLPDDLDNDLESEEIKKERESRDKKLFTIARQTGIQFLYLILLMIICSSNRGSHYFRQNMALKNAFSVKVGGEKCAEEQCAKSRFKLILKKEALNRDLPNLARN